MGKSYATYWILVGIIISLLLVNLSVGAYLLVTYFSDRENVESVGGNIPSPRATTFPTQTNSPMPSSEEAPPFLDSGAPPF